MKKHASTTIAIILLCWTLTACNTTTKSSQEFNGAQAYGDVLYQTALGPRTPGSPAHDKVVDWITTELTLANWDAEIQDSSSGQPILNIIGKRGKEGPWIILGAHYDSRLLADQDPDPNLRQQPVLGANDGASGVAVLLELARKLPEDLPIQLWLVFFDAEDNGGIAEWDWIMGSREFVAGLGAKPDAAIIVDMIGDANLNIPIEQNSTPKLVEEIWQTAKSLGYDGTFLSQPGYAMLDDHTPFLEAGIPAIDIIDFDYPYWHTSQDTDDKVSSESLEIVGKTLYKWLTEKR